MYPPSLRHVIWVKGDGLAGSQSFEEAFETVGIEVVSQLRALRSISADVWTAAERLTAEEPGGGRGTWLHAVSTPSLGGLEVDSQADECTCTSVATGRNAAGISRGRTAC